MSRRLQKIVASCLGMLAACALSAPAWPAAEPVVIGVNLSMTGGAAAYGQMTWNGIKLASQMRPTVLGRPVKLVLADNKTDAVEAANAASLLIKKEKAHALIGPETSTRALAAAPISEDNRIPLVSSSATNPLLTMGKKYVFRVCFIDPFQGLVAARHAYNNLGARQAAVLIDISQDYSVGLASFFMREFTRLGGKIVAQAKCATGDQDFSAQLGAIKASQADLLYLPNYYTEDALVARQALELGLKIPLLSGDGADAPELVQIGGAAVEGLAFTTHVHRQSATSQVALDFLARYDKARAAGELQEDLTGFHILAADAYLALMDAFARAGSVEGPRVRAALASTKDFTGISGKISIGEDGNAVKGATILKVAQGKFVYVTTVEP
jgi:branched-chain amino acid transport system substrate-binding protein